MGGDLADVFLFSLVAAANPTLLAATTAMLLLPRPERIMLGYLLGAFTTGIVVGLLIVFSLHGSSTESAAKHAVSPVVDLVVGSVNLGLAWVLASGRDAGLRRRRAQRREARRKSGTTKAPLTERMLGKGSPGLTFVVGALLSFPGLAYLVASITSRSCTRRLRSRSCWWCAVV